MIEKYLGSAWQPVFRDLSGNQLVEKLYQIAVNGGFSVALWRNPQSQARQVILDLSRSVKQQELRFNKSSAGFCFSPFDLSNGLKPYFIEANLFAYENKCWFRSQDADVSGDIHCNKLAVESKLKSGNGKLSPGLWYANPGDKIAFKAPNKEAYCGLIAKTIAAIQEKNLKKIVISRVLEVALSNSFNPLRLFNLLCEAYPNAFVNLLAIPEVGVWIGATPELLLSLKSYELTSVALAGTRSISSNNAINSGWGDKEIVEQQIVSEFIRDAFRKLEIHNFIEHPTQTVRIGDLLHLQTKFRLPDISRFPEGSAEALLKALHPTPAICGTPKAEALQFIRENEMHSREYYSGFLGPVNLYEQSRLYVNLRCMQLHEKSALLYAGGGITLDSNPEQEWNETELKLAALLNFLAPEPSAVPMERSA